MSYLNKIEASRRDLSHLQPEQQIVERTASVFRWVNRLLFNAEKALKPRRKLAKEQLTDESKKLLTEIDKMSESAEKDIKNIRDSLDKFIDKYSHLLQIPF